MTQKNITGYFLKESAPLESSSESDEPSYNITSSDTTYYYNLFKRKEELKQSTKIICEKGISECWNFFGAIKNRKVLQKYKFCKTCFEAEDFILKS